MNLDYNSPWEDRRSPEDILNDLDDCANKIAEITNKPYVSTPIDIKLARLLERYYKEYKK